MPRGIWSLTCMTWSSQHVITPGNYQHCFTVSSLPSTMSHLFDIRKQVLHPFFSHILLLTLSNSLPFMDRTTPIPSTSSSMSYLSPSSCGTDYECRHWALFFYLLLSNRSFQVLTYDLPRPTFLPQVQYHFNDYLKFEVTYGTLQGLLWLAYYYILDPLAAVRSIKICHLRRSHR